MGQVVLRLIEHVRHSSNFFIVLVVNVCLVEFGEVRNVVFVGLSMRLRISILVGVNMSRLMSSSIVDSSSMGLKGVSSCGLMSDGLEVVRVMSSSVRVG